MILSVSRRTDIPAYYAAWFIGRLRAGYALVRNPMNPRRISRIPLSPDVIDGIVFWTKNPAPMLPMLSALRDYPYYFQFTLTPYGPDIEPGLPPKNRLLETFLALSKAAGRERVVWRYDPILLSTRYTAAYHIEAFARMADALAAYTDTCIVSFLDLYRSIAPNMARLQLRPPSQEETVMLMQRFAQTAQAHGLRLCTCAEDTDLSCLGVSHASCIDSARLARIGGIPLAVRKDKNQRPACGCAESIDIGAYNTCRSGCVYCYANHSAAALRQTCANHSPSSPLLTGEAGPDDVITDRPLHSCRSPQMRLYD